MPTIDRGNVVLRATAMGSGPTVLLLHAGGEHRGVWSPVAIPLAESGIRTVAFDLRGHGDSGGCPTTLAEIAEDVMAMVRGEAAPVAVVGASLGGFAAIAALAEPATARRVTGLMLVDVAPALEPDRIRRWLHQRGLDRGRSELMEDILQRGAELLGQVATLDVPIMLVRGGPRSPLFDDDVARLLRANPRIAVRSVASAGHLVARDAPAELAGAIFEGASQWFDMPSRLRKDRVPP